MAEAVVPEPRTLAGWPLIRVAAVVVGLAMLVWTAWATQALIELQQRRIVSVSLSRLVEDFVAAEARNGGSPDEAAKRTSGYLSAVNRAVSDLGRSGTIVIVSEATLGGSVPDRTEQVRAAVVRAAEMTHVPR